jgi:hypothetical protein
MHSKKTRKDPRWAAYKKQLVAYGDAEIAEVIQKWVVGKNLVY